MNPNNTLRIFENGTAIITGGASGIGRALAEALAQRGCEVVLADLQIDLAQDAASRITAAGGRARAAEIDVADFPAVERLVRETAERTGRLDYMFNNAGIGIGGNVSHYGIDDWNHIIDINLRGVVHGIQAAYKVMAAQGFGHIVNTASMAGLMTSPGMAAYSMTKHGVVGLSKALRAEAAGLGVRVSVLCPGVIRTPILEGGGKYGRMLVDVSPEIRRSVWEKYRPMQPGVFAEKALHAIARNEAIVIIPSWWKMIWRLHRFFPLFALNLAQKQFQDMQKLIGPAASAADLP